MLCQACHNIFCGSFPPEWQSEEPHHASIQDLHGSAMDDCYICRVLWSTISHLQPDQCQVPATTGTTPTYEEQAISHRELSFNSRATRASLEFEHIIRSEGSYEERYSRFMLEDLSNRCSGFSVACCVFLPYCTVVFPRMYRLAIS
jgi:hypothetical protein